MNKLTVWGFVDVKPWLRVIDVTNVIIDRTVWRASPTRDALWSDQEEADRSTLPLWVTAEIYLAGDVGISRLYIAVKDDEAVVRICDVIAEVVPTERVFIAPALSDEAKSERICGGEHLGDKTRVINDVNALIEGRPVEIVAEIIGHRDQRTISLIELSARLREAHREAYERYDDRQRHTQERGDEFVEVTLTCESLSHIFRR